MECPITKKYGGYALTVTRMILGLIFFMHGSQKVLGWYGGMGLAGTIQAMTGIGLPMALAYLVSFGEFLGGIALLAGFLTQPAALGILIIMMGAVLKIHGRNGFFLDHQGYEYNLALMGMCLSLILGGGGRFAIDNFWCGECCDNDKKISD